MIHSEYYNPQFNRLNTMTLNGEWDFEIDNDFSGFKRDLLKGSLSGKIEVPFSPESELSGVGHKDFIKACWYKKRFTLEDNGGLPRTTLNFGAVDYEAKVYLNGKYVGKHAGGYTPFSFDITKELKAGENEITVYVEDNINANVPSGKQSAKTESFGCFYTRTTGIWQSVYLEFTANKYIKSVRYFTDISKPSVDIEAIVEGDGKFTAEVYYLGKLVGKVSKEIQHKEILTVDLSEKHLWDVGKGDLYDVVLTYGEDKVQSYFGLREVGFDGLKFTLNGRPVFQRLVLDQGYYPQGVYTAESEKDYINDIENAVSLGFNGARLHQKVFDPIYLYHCDRLGFMVWGEMPSWGIDFSDLKAAGNFLNEWREAVERDFNHPSIVVWCPLNEAWESLDDDKRVRDKRFCEVAYDFTKVLDSTRPCIDTSGGYHNGKTDIFDVHCYRGVEELENCLADLEKGEMTFQKALAPNENVKYKGQPVMVSEYGGKAFQAGATEGGATCAGQSLSAAGEVACVEKTEAWGYALMDGENSFVDDFIAQTKTMLESPNLTGFCYTQLYDIEQEQNGFFTYDRKSKLSQKNIQRIAEANKQLSVMEKDEYKYIEFTFNENKKVI